MKLSVNIDGVTQAFEWSGEGDGARFRLGEGEEREASLVEVEPGIYSVLVDGRSFEVKVVPSSNGKVFVDVGAHHLAVELLDPRRSTGAARGRRGDGPQEIAAPMPGRVVRVLAAEGETVTAGQGLIVVEAMKMQNEMKAPRDGKLLAVRVAEGATVAAGDVLAVIG